MLPVIVTLLSDFGAADSYVAQMKAVILSLAPDVRIVDVSHEVPPQDVLSGALLMQEVVPIFPRGTVHLGVVDPGVGTEREPIIVQTAHAILVGPNNGLLSLAAPEYETAHRIEHPAFRRAHASATFEGRDVFAPAAARVALGAKPGDAGKPIDAFLRIDVPQPTDREGVVLRVDRFGNLVTNVQASQMQGVEALCVGSVRAPVRRTYADVPLGQALAYVGSSGWIEIGIRQGSAAAQAGAVAGTRVGLER